MLTKEQKIVISIVLGALAVVIFVCLYGFTIGGEFFSFKYLIYCLVTSFIMTSLAFMFIFKRENFKKLFGKEMYIIVLLIIVALQMMIYQPLNLLSSSDAGQEYEVEVISRFRNIVKFFDKDGIAREKYLISDRVWPQDGGRMIVKETIGGFGCKYFELVEVTYEPEQ